MTLSYRSPHHFLDPMGGCHGSRTAFTANATPELPPEGARGVAWLMAHVVDVIAAGPMYEGRLSPVWAQMVRLYAQYLGVIPKRAPAARDDRSPRRQRLEKDLRALIPAIADLIDAQERDEGERDEGERDEGEREETDDESAADEAAADPQPQPAPDPAAQAAAQAAERAYELFPLTRLQDDGVMRQALGARPHLDTLHRVIQLALDACGQRVRVLHGPMAEISPEAGALAHRLARRWGELFRDAEAHAAARTPERLTDLHPDFFESQEQTYIRRYMSLNDPPD